MPINREVMLIMYDLPTTNAADRKNAQNFREDILTSGFLCIQESVYVKLVRNSESMKWEMEHLKKLLPPKGKINALVLPLRTFRNMKTLIGPEFQMSIFADDIVDLVDDDEEYEDDL